MSLCLCRIGTLRGPEAGGTFGCVQGWLWPRPSYPDRVDSVIVSHAAKDIVVTEVLPLEPETEEEEMYARRKVTMSEAVQFFRDNNLIDDPVRFASGVLGHTTWGKQRKILRSVRDNGRTSVKACHASSKSFTAAELALWWVTAFEDGICITTAPVFKQVRLVMWGEIHRMARGSLLHYPKLNQTELRISEDNYLIGISTDHGVNLQGFHGRILFILDEAVGIKGDIHEAIEGVRAGGDVRILALGNPTVPGGFFYDSFDPRLSRGWSNITISAFDSPNLRNITPDRKWDPDIYTPGITDPRQRDILATLLAMDEEQQRDNAMSFLISRWWVTEKWHEWGVSDNPLWYSRVLGQFPPQAEDALLSLNWIETAKWADTVYDPKGIPVEFGIDVAGPGEDETVVICRQGDNVLFERAFNDADPRGKVMATIREYGHHTSRVKVDTDGIGYNFALHIADEVMRHWPKVEVIGISVGKRSADPERFFNLKAELYWALRERFAAGRVRGIMSDTTEAQLATIRWGLRPSGQIEIESKIKMRKRGVKSPDRAEAYMLAFAPVVAPPTDDVVVYDEGYHISDY